MSSDEILKEVKADGWCEVTQNGSHIQLKHLLKRGRVTVPAGIKDLPKGTVNSILKQAGLK